MKNSLIALLVFTVSQLLGQTATDTTAQVDPNIVYDIVDVAPETIGGMKAFYQKIGENIRYPQDARQKQITGKVFIQFIVEKNGVILRENMVILRPLHKSLDEEAIRVILLTSPWQPGTKDGQPVRTRKTFPITFNLGGNKPAPK